MKQTPKRQHRLSCDAILPPSAFEAFRSTTKCRSSMELRAQWHLCVLHMIGDLKSKAYELELWIGRFVTALALLYVRKPLH